MIVGASQSNAVSEPVCSSWTRWLHRGPHERALAHSDTAGLSDRCFSASITWMPIRATCGQKLKVPRPPPDERTVSAARGNLRRGQRSYIVEALWHARSSVLPRVSTDSGAPTLCFGHGAPAECSGGRLLSVLSPSCCAITQIRICAPESEETIVARSLYGVRRVSELRTTG